MVRVFIKGGVWKNSEDEILKAAVMKYGKHQWARVASLLNRKSAKQCKARWHEWLDPSVRKVEWSRAEEEKLLHLAKLMPAQWRTIGPLIGRTASQCQEHYEKLLDEAAAGEAGTDESAQRQQQLRPGQIDSHPETKPARPDPIDMDEDEIEMLQEARARLANTQGKKAKRKAREKMLAEAKRLADLQKRRELKQAGLISGAARKRRKRGRDIDLGVEIPFHKPAPAGFHDVSDEVARAESAKRKRMGAVHYKRVNESQYRTRDLEEKQAQKREEARIRNLERSNMQYVVAQVSKSNDPMASRKRGPLELPAPAVSDAELGQLAKIAASKQETTMAAGNNAATDALLGDYSDRPLPTPMRTPMTAASKSGGHESIMREASNLRMLEQGQTPLLGGENPELQSTKQEDDTTAAAATPRLPVGQQTPMSLAPRDQLGLNRPKSELRDDEASVGASTFATSTMSIKEAAREERRALKRARKELEDALAALPAPQFEYELAAPQDQEEVGVETVDAMEEDAADVDAAERQRRKREAERLYEARSSVVKRTDLPRPAGVIDDAAVAVHNHDNVVASELVRQELLTLLRHDAHAFPVDVELESKKESKKKKKKKASAAAALPPETPLEYLKEESLDEAKDMVQAELDSMLEQYKIKVRSNDTDMNEEDALRVLSQQNTESSRDGSWVKSNETLDTESLKLEFQTLREAAAALRKRNDKTESKVAVKTGGYAKRLDGFKEQTLQQFATLQNSKIEQAVYANLQSHELAGGARRVQQLKNEVEALEEQEAVAQKAYGDLLLEKKRLMLKLKQMNTDN